MTPLSWTWRWYSRTLLIAQDLRLAVLAVPNKGIGLLQFRFGFGNGEMVLFHFSHALQSVLGTKLARVRRLVLIIDIFR